MSVIDYVLKLYKPTENIKIINFNSKPTASANMKVIAEVSKIQIYPNKNNYQSDLNLSVKSHNPVNHKPSLNNFTLRDIFRFYMNCLHSPISKSFIRVYDYLNKSYSIEKLLNLIEENEDITKDAKVKREVTLKNRYYKLIDNEQMDKTVNKLV